MEQSSPQVLHAVFDVYLPWSTAFLHRLLRELQGRVEQSVVTRQVRNRERFPGPPVDTVPTGALVRPRPALQAARHLRRAHEPDVLHAHMGYSALRCMLLRQMLGAPMVVTFGGADLDDRTGEPDVAEFYRYMFRHVDAFITVSDDLRERLIGLGCPNEKVRTVHRGVDPEEFPRADRRGRSGPVRMLMVGRFVPKKGHAIAVQALGSLRRQGVAFRAKLVGAGPLEAALRRDIRAAGLSEHVDLQGPVEPERMQELMAEADLLVHPSVTTQKGDREGVPNVIYEAQCTGLPVVASRHGGIPEVVLHEETGLLVPEGNPDALQGALARLAGDAALRRRLGRAGAQRMRRRFTSAAQARACVDIYRRLAADGAAVAVPEEPLPALLRRARRAWWQWTEPSLSDLASERGPAARGALRVARGLVPHRWRSGIKCMAMRALPGLFAGSGDRHADEDDRFWQELAGRPAPCGPGGTE